MDGVEDSQWSHPPAFPEGYWDNHGWGFGVSVVTRRGWASDPWEDLVAILMTQRAGFPKYSGVY